MGGEQSGWTAGKQPGAGSSLRQPEPCLTPAAPCPPHSSFAMLQGQGQLGSGVWEEYAAGTAGPDSAQEGGSESGLGEGSTGTSQPGSHVPIGCWGN